MLLCRSVTRLIFILIYRFCFVNEVFILTANPSFSAGNYNGLVTGAKSENLINNVLSLLIISIVIGTPVYHKHRHYSELCWSCTLHRHLCYLHTPILESSEGLSLFTFKCLTTRCNDLFSLSLDSYSDGRNCEGDSNYYK